MKRFVFVTLICLVTGLFTVNAQQYIDVLHVQYNYFHKSSVVDDLLEEDMGDIYTRNQFAGARVPIKLPNGDQMILGAGYYHSMIRQKLNLMEMDERMDLYSFQLPLVYHRNWKLNKLQTQFWFTPRLNSNLESFAFGHMQWNIGIINKFFIGNKFAFMLGVHYNKEAQGHFVTPAVGIDWNISDRVNLTALLPYSARLECKFSKRIYLGVEADMQPISYTLSEMEGTADDVILSTYNPKHYFGDVKAGVFVDYYFTKNMVLFGKVGGEFHRKLGVYTLDGEEVTESGYHIGDLPNTLQLSIGLAYRIRK